MEYDNNQQFAWVVSGINIVIGYLLLTNYNYLVKVFVKDKTIK